MVDHWLQEMRWLIGRMMWEDLMAHSSSVILLYCAISFQVIHYTVYEEYSHLHLLGN